jgi:hypothetical protein
MPLLKEEKKVDAGAYSPTGYEKLVQTHMQKRLPVLKKTKQNIIGDIDFEQIMKDADREYAPRSLSDKVADANKSVYLEADETTGLRGARIVPITGKEGTEWRSNVSEPTLFVKIQTALSILVDQNPEAVFKAILDRYKPTTHIAKAIWKRSWEIAESKEQMKNFIFNLAKYGWAIGRTYPRLVKQEGEILTELDVNNPDNNKYKKVTVVKFNDIYRQALDPFRTWIDDKTNLYDPYSQQDWAFEVDYDKDTFEREMGMYTNSKYIVFGSKESDKDSKADEVNGETKQRDDLTTLAFYESSAKDLYVIYCPSQDVVVYHSPLPNDDKMLSCWSTYWNLRDLRTPYGIGLFEILKNNKVLYDRLDNMTTDELTMAIYKMMFYSGPVQGDGKITVSPGVAHQKLPGTTIDVVDYKFDPRHFEGSDRQRERIDEITGITPTLQGTVEGKTLGEVLHAKDSALKRLNIPLANIASVIQKDAFLTLSWANQVYSLPEIQEFADEMELDNYMQETGREPSAMSTTPDGVIKADFPKQLDLGLSEDRDGTLIESPEARFFTIGQDIEGKELKWKGQITVSVQSIISPSQELERQRKLELYNVVKPGIDAIAMSIQQFQYKVALTMAKPIVQILEIQSEKPEAWLPEVVILMLDKPELADQMEAEAMQQQQQQVEEQQQEQPLFVDQNAEEAQPGFVPPATPAQPGTGAPTAPSSQKQQVIPAAPRNTVSNSTRASNNATSGLNVPIMK